MNSKEALSDLFFLAIGDENHTKKCKETIEKDLDRLEKITDILKDKLSVYEKAHYRLSVNGSLEYQKLTKQEYEILKDWLENENQNKTN